MAAPTFLQLIFGQPKLAFSFDHDDTGKDGRLLNVHLMNMPITNPMLQAFKVSRLTAQDICLSIRVFNASTRGVIISAFMPDIELSPSSRAGRIALPPSLVMANVHLVKWQRFPDSAVLLGGTRIPLPEGTYVVDIGIVLDNKTKVCKPISFHIGKTESEMMWEEKLKDKLWM
jgi:hypothetical protein